MFYSLPRTDLELQLELTLEDVSPGPLTGLIEHCKNAGTSDKLCEEEKIFNFKAKKATSSNEICKVTEGSVTKMTRFYSLGDKTQIAGVAVPDPSRQYFVDVTPKWYQTINASLQSSETGLAAEMTAGGSNAALEAGATVAIGLVGSLFSVKSTTAIARDLDGVVKTFAVPVSRSPVLKEKERKAVLKALREIAVRRNHLIFDAPVSGDAAPILAALDAEAANLRAIYEGTVKSQSTLVVRRISLRKDGSPDPTAADLSELTEDKRTIDPIKYNLVVGGCPGGSEETISIFIDLAPEPNSVVAALAQAASQPDLGSKQQGFRYRVPIPVRATIHSVPPDPQRKDTRLVDREFPVEIAQIGPTLTLPRKAGIWGGTVGAAFVSNTGRLKLFKTDSAANPSATIINQISSEARKDRNVEALEKEEHELDLKTKIKAHKAALEATDTD